MARPTKPINLQSRHNSKKEIEQRIEQEEKLKGNNDKIKPPTYLSLSQKKLFKMITEELKASGILCNTDIFVLAECVIAIDRMQEIEKIINNDISKLSDSKLQATKQKYTQSFFRCCNELSLSPQARGKLANLNISAQLDDEDPLLKALKGDDV